MPSTRFLNVDLDVRGSNDLLPLVTSLQAVLTLMHHQAGVFASFELATQPATPEAAIVGFVDLIERLPADARRVWDDADVRAFNIGIQAADEPRSVVYALSAQLLKRVVSIGAGVEITVYGAGLAKD